jgi:hypothetical protein
MMSLKDDIEILETHFTFEYRDTTSIAWDNIKTALNKLLIVPGPNAYTQVNEPDVVDSTPVYRCICGFETKTTSIHDQYCPCGEKMELVK